MSKYARSLRCLFAYSARKLSSRKCQALLRIILVRGCFTRTKNGKPHLWMLPLPVRIRCTRDSCLSLWTRHALLRSQFCCLVRCVRSHQVYDCPCGLQTLSKRLQRSAFTATTPARLCKTFHTASTRWIIHRSIRRSFTSIWRTPFRGCHGAFEKLSLPRHCRKSH